MKTRRNKREQARTNYIQLDTGKCEACWECIEVCSNKVFGRVNLPWHKHALIIGSVNCTGCLKCIKACRFNAISKVSITNPIEKTYKKNPLPGFIINIGLLLTGFLAVCSGFLIQFSYHMGHHGITDFNKTVLNINYSGWSNVQKIVILVLSLFMAFHIVRHWTWYKTIIKNDFILKNKQVFILSVIFIFVAITGYIPWIIDVTGNNEIARKSFIVIHDKLTILLFIFLILHVAKRLKWFKSTFKKIRNN
jgi:2-oxoglutarate ferredoxin oxidoreductase subunit delta